MLCLVGRLKHLSTRLSKAPHLHLLGPCLALLLLPGLIGCVCCMQEESLCNGGPNGSAAAQPKQKVDRGGLFRIGPQRDIAPDGSEYGSAANLTLGIVFEDGQAPAGGGG